MLEILRKQHETRRLALFQYTDHNTQAMWAFVMIPKS